jgi:hypothetical protein
MRIEAERKLFVGLKIDNKLRDALAHAPHRDRAFFDGSDPRYLREVRAVEDTYLGKVIDAAISVNSLDDVKRNVLSILHRISTSRRGEDDIKVFAIDDGEPPPLPPKESAYDRY